MLDKISRRDAIFLSLAVVVLTWQVYYLHQKINLFELGLYLPGIQGVMNGQVPYRDFFYLRGPLDLYIPAALMQVWGANVAVLATYFYVGTVITLIVCVLLACELIPWRILLYALVPVLVMRTFPRVVFTYWGGMRYAWGLLAILSAVYFLRKQAWGWLLAAGILTAIAGLTSIEIGVGAGVAITLMLCFDPAGRKQWWAYALGISAVIVPYFIYMHAQGAIVPYINAQMVVVTKMTKTFVQTQEPVPSNVAEVLHALFVPSDKNFRQMTPVYCYAAFFFYLGWQIKRRQLTWMDKAAAVLAVYGGMIYITGFRNLWSNVFEMALQPEKIILFYLLGRACIFCAGHMRLKKVLYLLLAGIVISSAIFSISRFNKRFVKFWRNPFKGQASEHMSLDRLKGMTLPKEQADDIEALKEFIDKHTAPGDKVWMYPELAAMHFILDRPWIGRFPTVTLSWFSEDWHRQYMQDLETVKPKHLIASKTLPDYFYWSYFPVLSNRLKYEEHMTYIASHYQLMTATTTYNIYERRQFIKGR